MTPAQLTLLRELIAVADGDALFRPSSIDRVIGCAGSVVAASRLPREKERVSGYALEGTAAHIVVEQALRGVRQPDEWTDRQVKVGPFDGFFVEEEMVDAANVYIGEVEARENAGTERFVEHRLSLATLDPSDPLLGENRGTADCLIVDRPRRKITIVDLKYGKGVMVASTSPQLRNYALMAMLSVSVEGGWESIETRVVQPRAHDWDRRSVEPPVVFTPMELMDDFLPRLVGAMETALDPAAPLTPGPWCRWCRVAQAGVCPALADKAFGVARDAFAVSPLFDASSASARAETAAPTLPSPLDLDPADVATILDRRELYDVFMQAVEKRAAALLAAGVAVPGWTLKPRTGNRRFRDAETAPDALRALGLQTAAIYTEPKLRSPAQIEKLLPKDKRDALGDLVERPEGEPALVRSDAKALTSPVSGFTPISAKAEG